MIAVSPGPTSRLLTRSMPCSEPDVMRMSSLVPDLSSAIWLLKPLPVVMARSMARVCARSL